MAIHVIVAALSMSLINENPFIFAQKALFPACSILIGLSMAWTTRASTMLQIKELREKLFTDERPTEDYIYGFQLAILVVIVMISYVAIMAGGGVKISFLGDRWDAWMAGFWMYFLISLTLRECWGVINATNMLSMLEYMRPK
ncbi:hypothetical protein [Sphingomonas sp. CROZ-RG-20F-R02-07]|uniref:hypothetical protein n=1 Tax=Sphingomonas sp. CROZ-RG-20F-R02-07 TaxID=2914832 RepID=UPI001F59E9A9|nr:hypothetical protein [Sphingomonas sp. CROZ-RG-20F-R02-07]